MKMHTLHVKIKKVQGQKSGFTLLFSVLISSVLLSIGVSIFSTTLKDLLFSSSGRDSQFAFYAADTGVECALYWDKKGQIFPTSTASALPLPDGSTVCNGEDIVVNWEVVADTNPTVTTFYLNREDSPSYDPTKACAVVRVFKDQLGQSRIDSFGYNTCVTSNPRRIERGIRVVY